MAVILASSLVINRITLLDSALSRRALAICYFRDVSVLVLGASGFLGSWAVRALVARGERTLVLAREESSLWRLEGLDDVVTVLRVPTSEWPNAIASLRPDILVSLDWAGVSGASRDDPRQWDNLDRLRAVSIAAAGSGARRIVGVGSQAEYGPHTGVIREDATERPTTEYGRAKLAGRHLLQQLASECGVEWAWARVFSAYGPLDHDHWLLPTVARGILAGEPVPLTAGVQRWGFLYGADAGEALASIALAGISGVFNVGAPNARRLRGILEEFAQNFEQTAELRFGAIPYPPNAVMHLAADVRNLLDLGWSQRTPDQRGLEATASWLAGRTVRDPLLAGRVLPKRS